MLLLLAPAARAQMSWLTDFVKDVGQRVDAAVDGVQKVGEDAVANAKDSLKSLRGDVKDQVRARVEKAKSAINAKVRETSRTAEDEMAQLRDKLTKDVSGVVDEVLRSTATKGAEGAVAAVVADMETAVRGAAETGVSLGPKLKEIVEEAVKEARSSLSDVAGDAAAPDQDTVAQAVEDVSTSIGKIKDAVVEQVASAVSKDAKRVAEEVLRKASEGLSKVAGDAKIREVAAAAAKRIGEQADSLKDTVQKGIRAGLPAVAEDIKSEAKKFAGKVRDGLREALGTAEKRREVLKAAQEQARAALEQLKAEAAAQLAEVESGPLKEAFGGVRARVQAAYKNLRSKVLAGLRSESDVDVLDRVKTLAAPEGVKVATATLQRIAGDAPAVYAALESAVSAADLQRDVAFTERMVRALAPAQAAAGTKDVTKLFAATWVGAKRRLGRGLQGNVVELVMTLKEQADFEASVATAAAAGAPSSEAFLQAVDAALEANAALVDAVQASKDTPSSACRSWAVFAAVAGAAIAA
jgi:hypothetical protein